MKITNDFGIDLPLAVWLLQDGYNSGADIAPEGELISATTLMKPTRQLILSRQLNMSEESMDISSKIAARMGHALHDSIEVSWTKGNWQKAMRMLKYPQSIIDRIKINPKPEDLKEDTIPIYLEKRGFKEFYGIVVTGQLDFLMNTAYRDFKSTSTYAWTSGSKDDDYILQGSIYRWILPDLITDDTMRIEFIFTDWASYRAKADKNYPQTRIAHREYPLMSLEDTEQWIKDKIDEIKANAGKPQSTMIRCTDKELWKGPDSYKYYSNPETLKKGGRCTKRFTSLADAELHKTQKGKGVIATERGEVKACLYCPAFTNCLQRKEYFKDDATPIK